MISCPAQESRYIFHEMLAPGLRILINPCCDSEESEGANPTERDTEGAQNRDETDRNTSTYHLELSHYKRFS